MTKSVLDPGELAGSSASPAEDRLRLLADVGALLGGGSDYQETLQQLADLVVHRFADWCVVDVGEPDGMRRLAVAHRDPDLLRLARAVQDRYPSDPATGMPAQVMASGEPRLIANMPENQLIAVAQDERHARELQRLGLRSVLIVPLAVRGESLGALSLIRSDGRAAFTEADIPFVQEMANRAASAIDRVRLLDELSEAVRLRDDFLAVISHDMRTPLAAVLGYVQLAGRRLHRSVEPVDPKLEGYLSAAERTTEHLTDLVGDLMDVSLLRSGQNLNMHLEPIDLRELAETCVTERQRLVDDRRFILELPEGPVMAMADERRLRRVLDNVVDNAVKFSEPGGRISVSVSASDEGAALTVTDDGRGIPEAELPLIFERFRRGSNASGVRGTGLGLTGSRDIVRQLGGAISVVSKVGVGSTFTVRVPAAPPPR